MNGQPIKTEILFSVDCCPKGHPQLTRRHNEYEHHQTDTPWERTHRRNQTKLQIINHDEDDIVTERMDSDLQANYEKESAFSSTIEQLINTADHRRGLNNAI